MPAAARQSDWRPSAPMTSRAAIVAAVVERDRHAAVAGLDRRDGAPRSAASDGSAGGARVERGDQMPVLDVVAERLEPDLGRRERHLRRADEPPRVVDQPDRGQRRGVVAAQRPDLQRLQRGDRSRTSSAVVRLSGGGAFAISAVSMPAAASAIAAVSPAGPPPTTATSTLCVSPSIVRYASPSGGQKRPRFRPHGGLRYDRGDVDACRKRSDCPRRRCCARWRGRRRIALGCIAALAACGWIDLGLILAGQNSRRHAGARCARRSTGAAGSPAPRALTVRDVVRDDARHDAADRRADDPDLCRDRRDRGAKGEPAVSPLVLTAGYVAVWLGSALVLTALQIAARARRRCSTPWRRRARSSPARCSSAPALYQFSALKQACLTQCQRPFPFFFANWTAEPRGVFRLGLRQGLYCLGCCWAMMLVMFAVGAMNVVWMAVARRPDDDREAGTTARFSARVGVVFVAIGLVMIVETSVTGWPRPG